MDIALYTWLSQKLSLAMAARPKQQVFQVVKAETAELLRLNLRCYIELLLHSTTQNKSEDQPRSKRVGETDPAS